MPSMKETFGTTKITLKLSQEECDYLAELIENVDYPSDPKQKKNHDGILDALGTSDYEPTLNRGGNKP